MKRDPPQGPLDRGKKDTPQELRTTRYINPIRKQMSQRRATAVVGAADLEEEGEENGQRGRRVTMMMAQIRSKGSQKVATEGKKPL